jgi:hypothetical protein
MRLHPPQIALRNPNNGAAGGPLASGAGNVPVSRAIAIASRFIGPGPSGAENLEPVCYSYHTTESTGQAARYARRVNRGQDTIHVPTYAVVLVRQRFKPGPAHYNKHLIQQLLPSFCNLKRKHQLPTSISVNGHNIHPFFQDRDFTFCIKKGENTT